MVWPRVPALLRHPGPSPALPGPAPSSGQLFISTPGHRVTASLYCGHMGHTSQHWSHLVTSHTGHIWSVWSHLTNILPLFNHGHTRCDTCLLVSGAGPGSELMLTSAIVQQAEESCVESSNLWSRCPSVFSRVTGHVMTPSTAVT